ncbi:hypothetical protein G6F46_011052 [Rhizopus delemar]|uniref:Uncharacterized protein n=3 Tax=Rhizopus TaxID=4842 RepID=I1BHF0_RHIO9|nr:hypothetical protein RO3G_00334 [Rhizopus delemar RA 99-880]KAG1448668.1 hypothetical protein G6F55_010526 [Rhizopus delemar]KAG1622941.1 hypothetical protein G6F45_011037 [Rhizopus arrhizus]KAG1490235.1 hypothetical protein G6F54_010870 [Rhizopus delemar]KAG1501925.1 hypothetical protein G6F53_010974 [Rhizopus delemar]|eukprot:EIE75630.1 hypothetical protein RO3G_00334 [Rhizopus delemar RA 99-880]
MKAEYCVDYLSYKWKTDDLIETYRETRKHSIVNKLKQDKHEEYKLKRLQNALWREMARNCTSNLSQSNLLIDPSLMSWQKESDITWLYGPIYTNTKTQVYVPTSHLEGVKPVLKRQNTAIVQHSPLPTYSDDLFMVDYHHLSNNTTLVSSRNNSFSSISTTTTNQKAVYFNPEIIEIEYQPEYPVTPTSFPLMEEHEDIVWLPLLEYVKNNISTLQLFILLFKSFISFTTGYILYRWVIKKKKIL